MAEAGKWFINTDRGLTFQKWILQGMGAGGHKCCYIVSLPGIFFFHSLFYCHSLFVLINECCNVCWGDRDIFSLAELLPFLNLFKNWNTSTIFIKCTGLLKRHWGLLKRQILEPYHNWIGFCCSFILLFLTFYFVLSLFPLPYCFSCAISCSEHFKLCFFCQWEDSYCFNSEWSHHMVSDVSPKS